MLTSKLSTNSMCTQKHRGYARDRRYSESSVSLGVVCLCLSIYCTATSGVNLIQIPVFVSASLGYLAVFVFWETVSLPALVYSWCLYIGPCLQWPSDPCYMLFITSHRFQSYRMVLYSLESWISSSRTHTDMRLLYMYRLPNFPTTTRQSDQCVVRFFVTGGTFQDLVTWLYSF